MYVHNLQLPSTAHYLVWPSSENIRLLKKEVAFIKTLKKIKIMPIHFLKQWKTVRMSMVKMKQRSSLKFENR